MNIELDEQTKANISGAYYQMAQRFSDAQTESTMPHVLMRPALLIDGNMWIALYGENLQDGVAGCGESPFKAMEAFDEAWYRKLTHPTPKEGA